MIRKPTAADREKYIEIAGEFYATDAVLRPVPRAYFERTFDEMLSSDCYAEGYLFEQKGEIAGYALIAKTFSQEAGGKVFWLEEIYVREKFRGQGIAAKFLSFLIERANACGARLRLEAEKENEKAIRLYEQFGFVPLPYAQFVKEFDKA